MADREEVLRRWRLVLGGGASDGVCAALDERDARIDAALSALYADDPGAGGEKPGGQRQGGLGGSAPRLARWLGDIREFFPAGTVRVIQRDAVERAHWRQLLLEPELLETLEPDVHLVADLIALSALIPARTKETARQVVGKLVDELMRRFHPAVEQALRGSRNRALRRRRPRPAEIDWDRTIRANLRHWQPERRLLIPETLHGHGRMSRRKLQDIVLVVDQSGSMAASVVYAGIFAAVLASLPLVTTRLILFDTSVVDMTEKLTDPVDLLFGAQLGGGTDINRALAYAQGLVTRPDETTIVLITDLYEGGDARALTRRAADIVAGGTQLITLLALNDDGAPGYSHGLAQAFANLGSPTFACTPDRFPDLMAAALQRRDILQWAAENDIVATPAKPAGPEEDARA